MKTQYRVLFSMLIMNLSFCRSSPISSPEYFSEDLYNEIEDRSTSQIALASTTQRLQTEVARKQLVRKMSNLNNKAKEIDNHDDYSSTSSISAPSENSFNEDWKPAIFIEDAGRFEKWNAS
ncbi:hypothetical protein TCAL_01967 [Tigriopus californicus]|uniref:Corticotropin-releasing factor domain-containing protein n=1 Tax=Tigriopus californicus TaxID=6832 RepID=A0A553PPY3_TIGCA|nr:hypothetical protein TCAL_01967 [Tigriopus californicus]|eukprot:TCALIF_01967-PA protein Name:"Protein of unknown function" AED:0.14 eAED:0.14 QI:0/0/0.5/1/0/0.5/2/170/120